MSSFFFNKQTVSQGIPCYVVLIVPQGKFSEDVKKILK